MTRFKRYPDGRTAIQRLTGRRWGRPVVLLFHVLVVVLVWSQPSPPAVHVGHHGRSGALMALTEHGAVNARSFKRLPESDRFVASKVEGITFEFEFFFGG